MEGQPINRVAFDAIFEASGVPMAVCSPAGDVVHANFAFKGLVSGGRRRVEQAIETLVQGICRDDKTVAQIDIELSVDKDVAPLTSERKMPVKIIGKRLSPFSDGVDSILVTLEDRSEFAELVARLADARDTKNRFLANLSHEVRTPMNQIMGITDLLLGTRLNESQKDLLAMLSQSTERLMGLLSDMLDYSRLKIGPQACDYIDFDLRLLLETIGEHTGVKAVKKNIEFELDIHSLVPSLLKGDPGRLRKILNHLCDNAVKFTDWGKIELNVFPDGQIPDQVRLKFEIRDTGPGIQETDMGKIFDIFTQLDDSSTRKQEGSGLGLAFAGELINSLNGSMGVENRSKTGACFWFILEFSRQDGYQGASRVFSLDAVKEKQVLISTPDSGELKIFTRLIKEWGGLCRTAESAGQVERIVEISAESGTPVDIVIMDSQLPGANGDDLAYRLAKLSPGVPPLMVMLTSRAQPGDAKLFSRAGVKVYLPKPVRANELGQALAVALSQESPIGIITRHTLREYRKKMVKILIVGLGKASGKMILNTLVNAGYNAVIFEGADLESFDRHHLNVVLTFADNNVEGGKIVSKLQELKERRPDLRIHNISHSLSSKEMLKVVEKQVAMLVSTFGDHTRPATDNHPIFDYHAALNRAMGDKFFLKTLLKEFQGAMMSKIAMFKQAVDGKDNVRASILCQSIRGASGNMGADGVFHLIKETEQLVDQRDWEGLSIRVTALEKEATRFKNHLTYFNWERI